jgi:RNA polymerase sigma-70 factor (ECF subfamily)
LRTPAQRDGDWRPRLPKRASATRPRLPPPSLQRNATAAESRGRAGWVRRVSRATWLVRSRLLLTDDAPIGGNLPGKDSNTAGVLGKHGLELAGALMSAVREYARRGTVSVTLAPRKLDPERLGDHFDRLYRAAWALCGSREDAEDLVQETYARVLRKPRLLHSDDDLGYLLRVMRNTYFSAHRAASRRPRTEPLPDQLESIEDHTAPGPQQALEAGELYALIGELPDGFREALIAVDVLGLSYREAANALQVREATITTRLFRARMRLAQALSDQDKEADRASESAKRLRPEGRS